MIELPPSFDGTGITPAKLRAAARYVRQVNLRRARNKAAARKYRDKGLADIGFVRRKILARYWYCCLWCSWRALVTLGSYPLTVHRATCQTPRATFPLRPPTSSSPGGAPAPAFLSHNHPK